MKLKLTLLCNIETQDDINLLNKKLKNLYKNNIEIESDIFITFYDNVTHIFKYVEIFNKELLSNYLDILPKCRNLFEKFNAYPVASRSHKINLDNFNKIKKVNDILLNLEFKNPPKNFYDKFKDLDVVNYKYIKWFIKPTPINEDSEYYYISTPFGMYCLKFDMFLTLFYNYCEDLQK